MPIKSFRYFVVLPVLFIAACKNGKNISYTPQKAPVHDLGKNLSFKNSREIKARNGASAHTYMERMIKNGVHSSELMLLSSGLASFITMYEVTDSIKYLDQAYNFSRRIINSAEVSSQIAGNLSPFKDRYKTWINLNPKHEQTKLGSPHMKEYPLYESYFLRYLAKLLYLTSNETRWIRRRYSNDYRMMLQFLITDGWEKWYERGKSYNECFPFLFRSRAHMTSHWAIVAMYLNELVSEPARQQQYEKFLELYNTQLRDNLRITSNDAYIWNQTWDSPWPIGTNCNKPSKPIIQDGSHGNHVIAYVVEAYEAEKGWSSEDIKRFVNTVKTLLYNSNNQSFYADLNQSEDKSYAGGLRFGDGFLKLARYDEELYHIFEEVREKQKSQYHYRYNEPQYVAEFMLVKKYYRN